MYRSSDSVSPLAAIPFHLALVFLGAYIIVNLFIAVVKVRCLETQLILQTTCLQAPVPSSSGVTLAMG
jgi:hypothetical protein